MPCLPSHTKGPGADEYQADEGERQFYAEPTVRGQLLEALEKIAQWHHGDHTGVFQDCRSLICVQARAAIERANREPTERLAEKLVPLYKHFRLASARLNFVANWLENTYAPGSRDAAAARTYADAAKKVLDEGLIALQEPEGEGHG